MQRLYSANLKRPLAWARHALKAAVLLGGLIVVNACGAKDHASATRAASQMPTDNSLTASERLSSSVVPGERAATATTADAQPPVSVAIESKIIGDGYTAKPITFYYNIVNNTDRPIAAFSGTLQIEVPGRSPLVFDMSYPTEPQDKTFDVFGNRYSENTLPSHSQFRIANKFWYSLDVADRLSGVSVADLHASWQTKHVTYWTNSVILGSGVTVKATNLNHSGVMCYDDAASLSAEAEHQYSYVDEHSYRLAFAGDTLHIVEPSSELLHTAQKLRLRPWEYAEARVTSGEHAGNTCVLANDIGKWLPSGDGSNLEDPSEFTYMSSDSTALTGAQATTQQVAVEEEEERKREQAEPAPTDGSQFEVVNAQGMIQCFNNVAEAEDFIHHRPPQSYLKADDGRYAIDVTVLRNGDIVRIENNVADGDLTQVHIVKAAKVQWPSCLLVGNIATDPSYQVMGKGYNAGMALPIPQPSF